MLRRAIGQALAGRQKDLGREPEICTRLVGLFGCLTWRPRGLSKSVISRVIVWVTPVRVLITLLIAQLLSPLGLQVGFRA